MGKNYISFGEIRMASSISYLNPKKMHYLVGKTIRDNILFGHKFNIERYDEILKFLGVQFGNYEGQDLQQIAEKGCNIKNEDLRNILLARFLYQDSDIYIIDEYFGDINLGMSMTQTKKMLQNILQNKTVIFVANDPELVQLTDLMVCFKSDQDHCVIKTKDFIDHSFNFLQ